MSLATTLMAVGIPAETANRIGYADRVPLDGNGTTQLGATEVLRDNTNIAMGTSVGDTAFILPAETEYFLPYFLLNTTAETALIFPPVGDTIDANALNAAVEIETDLARVFMRVEEGRWVSMPSGEGGGGIEAIVAGPGISVDNTDPDNPVVSNDGVLSVSGGSGVSVDVTNPQTPIVINSGVLSVTAGSNVTITGTPQNPIINSSNPGGTVTAVSVATANGLAGSSSGGATPALTISTTVNAPALAGNGTAIVAATTTGTGAVALQNSPTFVTPTLGEAAATSMSVSPTPSSTMLGWLSQQTGAGTVSGTPPTPGGYAYNHYYIPSDGIDASGITNAPVKTGLVVEMYPNNGGVGMGQAMYGIVWVPPSSTIDTSDPDLVGFCGVTGVGRTDINLGGTNTTSGAQGGVFGLNGVGIAAAGATNLLGVVGLEIDVQMHSGSSTSRRSGITIVDQAPSTGQGAVYDAALNITASGSVVGWRNGILFGAYSGTHPMDPVNGKLLSTQGAATTHSGIDISSYTFLNSAFRSAGFVVNPTGNITVAKASPVLTLDKAASGQDNLVLGRTNGVNRWAYSYGNATAESGANAGSDFAIIRYDDSGSVLGGGYSVVMFRSTGLFSLPGGSLGRGSPITKTADFTLGDTENWIINNKTGSACVMTLPSAASYFGREVMVKNTQAQQLNSASANVVPLAGGAAATAILTANVGRWAVLVSNGTNWVIMSGVV